MITGLNLQKLCDDTLTAFKSAGAEEISIISGDVQENMIRFSNNSVTVVKSVNNRSVSAYITKNRRRIMGATSNLNPKSLHRFAKTLVQACSSLDASPHHIGIPKGPFHYSRHTNFDKSIDDSDPNLLSDYVKHAIDKSLKNGGKRIAGSISAESSRISILTTGGIQANDKSTYISLNIRVFINNNVSGHGLSCATKLNDFKPIIAAESASDYAKRSRKIGPWNEGKFDVILSPTVSADIIQNIGDAASAFSVDTGMSFLSGKKGRKISSEQFTLTDHGTIKGCLAPRIFDDEGIPTRDNSIINKGKLSGYLHNSSTAQKSKTTSTGSAGIIDPHPWNLEVSPGDFSLQEIIESVKKGFLITNNWYTRFQNMRTGEYSTLPRDAAFYIEGGKIKHAVNGIRLSDSIPRQLKNIDAIGSTREWIHWWEVNTPCLAPWLLVRDVPVTRAVS